VTDILISPKLFTKQKIFTPKIIKRITLSQTILDIKRFNLKRNNLKIRLISGIIGLEPIKMVLKTIILH
jgi:hypothetical protein